MTNSQSKAVSTVRSLNALNGRVFLWLALSGISVVGVVLLPIVNLKPLFLGVGAGFLVVSIITVGNRAFFWVRGALDSPRLSKEQQSSDHPIYLTDTTGNFLNGNESANQSGVVAIGQNVSAALAPLLADASETVARMSAYAVSLGTATETLANGMMLRVTLENDGWLEWQIQEDRESYDQYPHLPKIVLEEPNKVTAVNDAGYDLLGHRSRALDQFVLDPPMRNGGTHIVQTPTGVAKFQFVEDTAEEEKRSFVLVAPPSKTTAFSTMPALSQPDLLNALPVPMLKISVEGTLIEANAQARGILKLDADDLPPLFELVEGMGRPIADWLSDAAEGRGLLKPEIVRAVVPGQELFLQIAIGRTVENGRVVLVGILNDATELKTLEAQFVQSQKMQAIGQLAGGVAHDFNNLLTAISGHCDLLLLRHDAGDPDYADLIQISQNANRAASLVGQLLAFSRKQNLKPQALDLRDTMSDLVHLLNRLIGERIQLEVTHEPGPKAIRADRRQLEQVIVNLVVNARDAMPDGGMISIRTRSEFLGEEIVRDRAHLVAGKYVVIEVRDTGVGISPDGLSKIFEPFYTTKKTGEGTGLGLSTAYGIVKQTGGFIFVDSAPGEGTVFSLYFPANVQKDIVPQVKVEKPKVPKVSDIEGVVLLVEDEAPVRAFAGRALRLSGHTVLEAENAEMALEILEDRELHIDVFVTDVVMPGMDGPSWVRQAQRMRPDTKVVFMSGYAEEGSAEKQARIPNSAAMRSTR